MERGRRPGHARRERQRAKNVWDEVSELGLRVSYAIHDALVKVVKERIVHKSKLGLDDARRGLAEAVHKKAEAVHKKAEVQQELANLQIRIQQYEASLKELEAEHESTRRMKMALVPNGLYLTLASTKPKRV